MNTKYLKNSLLILSLVALSNCKHKKAAVPSKNPDLKPVTFSYAQVSGIGFEKGITRRDPSDIINVDGTCYVYYTKVIGQAAGYWGDLWYATSKDDGYTWQEAGRILGVGAHGAFDSQAVFTPNIIKSKEKYYLFYTGVKPTPGRTDGVFENNSTTDITAIGLAVADGPQGPFKRFTSKPILEVDGDSEQFDSYRVDDAALLFKDGKYLLFYKGRSRTHKDSGPQRTQMGVAIADQTEGPYVKYGKPILDRSHEVMVWKQGQGVAALASMSSTLEYSKTGFDFTTHKKSIKVADRPNAPGAYRADLTGGAATKLTWGISMVHNGPDCYLQRYRVKEDEHMTLATPFKKGTFGFDRAFLKKNYKQTIILESKDKKAKLALSPELQGRVMTSTLDGDNGMSFGWLNYDLISSKEIKQHINPTGGEERFWLGPEGGQYSIYFTPKSSFEFKNWYVPAVLDTEAFTVVEQEKHSAQFQKKMHLTNYSGTPFDLEVQRKITLLTKVQINESLQLGIQDFSAVAYETANTVTNIGTIDWKKETGLLSVWLLSMFSPSPETTVIIPINKGTTEALDVKVNEHYFGKIAPDRLKLTEQTIFFKADGKSRGKIGVFPARATGFIGSYDAKNEILTLLEIAKPNKSDPYVNAAWEHQDHPYAGDVINSYNDGKLEDGSQMGPFYEMESSSPALALAVGESHVHTQRIYHFKGKKEILDTIAEKILKVSIDEIKTAF